MTPSLFARVSKRSRTWLDSGFPNTEWKVESTEDVVAYCITIECGMRVAGAIYDENYKPRRRWQP